MTSTPGSERWPGQRCCEYANAVDEIGLWIRQERDRLGLSTRELARLSQVSYPTISRIENGREQPRWNTIRRIAAALGASIGPPFEPLPLLRLADLVQRWTRDELGEVQPDWTMWRAFADQLQRSPELTAAAIMPAPMPSGVPLIDNLLAATAEKVADDAGIRRPSWVNRFPPLREIWRAPGTPRIRARHDATTPAQFRARNIIVSASAIWRDDEQASA